MKRRTFLAAAGTAAAVTSFPAPVVAQGIREIKIVGSLPIRTGERFAQTVTAASGGRLKVKVFQPGELVGSFEVFDAVSEGIAEMYWSPEYYWAERSPAFSFFTTVPFGLTPLETYAWIEHGGGQELWDELSARFNLKALPVGNSGIQMGGWFAKEITSIEDFKGLRYRIPALGGEIMRRLGAIVVNLPARDIVPAMKSGALDAAEWIGPSSDMRLGLHTAVKYYYYPGFHEPATIGALGINKEFWDGLSAKDQTLLRAAASDSYVYTLMDYHVGHMKALPLLLERHGVQLRKFDDEILQELGKISGEVVAEVGASDPFTRRVYESYIKFRNASLRWTDISERAYLNARALKFSYGN